MAAIPLAAVDLLNPLIDGPSSAVPGDMITSRGWFPGQPLGKRYLLYRNSSN
jgi:hypothetical protein